jgi:hypothetical protein
MKTNLNLKQNFVLRRIGKDVKTGCFFLSLLFLFFSNSSVSQIGTMTGIGHDCKTYSFSICPNQTITPFNYLPFNFSGCKITSLEDVSFNFLPGVWRVDRSTWTFTSTCSGQIRGTAIGGGPIITIPFGAGVQVSPNSYPGANGISFNLNGIQTGSNMNRNTFSITLNSTCGSIGNSSFTCCANSTTCNPISPIIPNIGGPYTFTWQPGNLTGSVVCCPTANIVYTVVATSRAGCTSTAQVAVTVSNCPAPSCCIGNICQLPIPGTNPLFTNWEVPLNNNNYVFSGQGGPGNSNYRVGIGTNCSPGNKLEIDNGTGPANNISGLRLTDLNNFPIPFAPNGRVLSVDINGDVILTTASGGPALGGLCPSANVLTGDYEIPMNNWNFNFTTPALSNKGQVLIGRPNCNSFAARLDVEDDFIGRGIYGFSSRVFGAPLGNNIGIHGNGTDAFIGPNVTSIGVLGEVNGLNSTSRFAGVAGFCGTPNLNALPGRPVAIYGNNGGNPNNWGGYFEGDVGVNGDVLPIGNCTWNVGLPGNNREWNSMTSCLGFFTTSDARRKENIKPLGYGIKDIMELKPVSYNLKGKLEEHKIGFLAQDLKKIIPEVVREGNDADKTMSVNYADLVSLLVKGMQDQQQQINELKTLVQSLAGVNSAGAKPNNSQAVELSDKNAIVLNQNVPNPFAESTVINYNIPVDFTKAQIIFNTTDGKIIKVVDITSKGKGSLNVFANDLTHGMYTYFLIVDGKTIDTKKMIKE